jgi:nitrite reductase/ring-hydroxylating ferredoxin subunit
MNALLLMGNLANDNIVTCPFHRARLYITTGKKGAYSDTFTRNGTITKNMAKVFGTCSQLMAHIKTYHQEIYETKIQGDSVKIKI